MSRINNLTCLCSVATLRTGVSGERGAGRAGPAQWLAVLVDQACRTIESEDDVLVSPSTLSSPALFV